MSILRLEGVHREVGTFVILDRIDAAIAMGDRIGLVGPNGAGKTTLLRIAAGVDEPDEGRVSRKRDLTIGMLAQEAHLDERFMASPDLRTAVRHGGADLEAMAVQLEALEHAHRAAEPEYAVLQHRFETLGGYTLDQRVDEALGGLGFSVADMTRPPSSLSGGEQTRATLARLVIAVPDLLFLDEPTNHLDLGALEWLEDHLRRRSGSLLVASHDRAFLDAAVNRIWELRDRKLTAFRGDYSSYHRQREERDALAVKSADTQEQQIARERELVQTFRTHRKFAKMHEHEARLERLLAERSEAPKAQRKLKLPTKGLVGAGPVRSGEIVVRVDDLVVGYLPAKRVATAPFLAARRGDRIGIVGPNGAGKTTLLRTIAGDLPPLDGSIAFGNGVQLGYLAQLRAAAFPGSTVLDALLESIPVTPGEARGYLARFLFRGDDVMKEVRLLSGGERSRLELALLGVMPSNVYLLDEPTNHLDVVAREAIESFLLETPATMLVVSHDRRFLDTVCERLWVVDDGQVAPFDGGYRAWRSAVSDGWTVAGALEQEARRLRPVDAQRAARAWDAASGSSASGSVASRSSSSGSGAANVSRAPGAPAGRAPDSVTGSGHGAGGTGKHGAASDVDDDGRNGGAAAGGVMGPGSANGNGAAPRLKVAKLSKDAYRRQREAVDADLTRLGLRKNHLELELSNPSVQANFIELRRASSELADVETALAAAEDAWLALEERAP
ncbi:MAG TPA: ABC-F family ATP-binding cassette domain-containing protein [Candidatus Limnocylindria bacterium]|nr:ABC-F family ATP-binding cassette domain-containing protein [Candidatus Limnocylindria bacterium]